jgi:hypothetical protein
MNLRLFRDRSDICRNELRNLALKSEACLMIMHPDARQHGCLCQGVRWRKVARMEARAFKPSGACSPLSVHGSTTSHA